MAGENTDPNFSFGLDYTGGINAPEPEDEGKIAVANGERNIEYKTLEELGGGTGGGNVPDATKAGQIIYAYGTEWVVLNAGKAGQYLKLVATDPYVIPSWDDLVPVPAPNAKGDIMYTPNGTTWTRLPVGSDGEVLGVASGLPTWLSGGSGGGEDLADTLAEGNSTGGTDIQMSSGDALAFEDGGSVENTGGNLVVSRGPAVSGNGGDVVIQAQSGDDDGDGGDVVLSPGVGDGAGDDGVIDASGARIVDVADPVDDQDVATKAYVDSVGGGGGGSPGGSSGQVQYNASGSFDGSSAFTFDPSTDLLVVPNVQISGSLELAGSINDTLSTDPNDYNPSGLADASIVRMAISGGFKQITGIAAQPAGTVLLLQNLDTAVVIYLLDQSTSSSTNNRFALPNSKSVIIPPESSVIVRYDGTLLRWVCDSFEMYISAGGIELHSTRNQLVRSALTGDVTATAGSNATTIANDAVTDAKLRDSGACSVIGRSANSSGDPADISASTNDTVFCRTGNALTFTTIATAMITNSAVTYAKIQNVSATDRLLGRDTAAAGVIEELTVGGGLEFTGSAGIQRSALTGDVTASAGSNTTVIANNAVTNAQLADVATATIKGRTTASTGDPEDLTAAQAQAVLNTAARAVSNQQQALFVAEIDDGNSSTADTIDWTAGPAHKSTLTGNCTYTFTAPSGVTSVVLKVIQDGTGGRTITWPASVKNTTGLNASLITTLSTTSIVSFYWDGTNYWPALVCTGVA